MTSCCVRYLNWFINQMVEPCFWSSGFMLSPLLEDKKMLSLLYQAVNHKNLSWSTQLLLHGTSAALIFWWKSLWRERKGEKKQTLAQALYDNFYTCVRKGDTGKRRDHVRVKRPNQLRRTDRSLSSESAAQPFSLLCRRGFLPAVSSHPLNDGRPQLASCFSLTNGNFTVLHQSVVFTSLSLLSPVPELTVWLQQQCGSRTGVCRRSLRAWHHSYHFCTL